MGSKDQSIKRKTMAVIMLTTVAVLFLTAAAFTAYDLLTYRQSLVQSLSATAAILADHSTAALALRDEKDARATLASLRADPRIVAGALYDGHGSLFARYPAQAPVSAFPSAPGKGGYRYEGGRLNLFEPVMDGGVRLGTLYLKSDPHSLFVRLRFYGGIALLVLFGSILVALLQFGAIVSVVPGAGALAFASVVILTMLAAQTFDPRLMWESAGAQAPDFEADFDA